MALTRKAQVVLTLMPGAEPWIRVTHKGGWFKVPGDVCVAEVLAGAVEGWTSTRRRLAHSEATVRVPLDQWLAVTGGTNTPMDTTEWGLLRRARDRVR